MTGLRFTVLFCVLFTQRVASQSCNCQSDLYISMDDLMKALNNGPGIPGLIESSQNQYGSQPNQCGCQPSQCGCQPPCQQINQCSQPQQNKQCCQQQKPQTALVVGKPTYSISGLGLGNQCGCQQSNKQSQPIQINQPCGCQQSNQQCSCQPIQISQPCGCQQSQQSQQCGCQQSLSISNPSISFQPVSQPTSQPKQSKQLLESVPACIVPAALLQAPPYGIIFAGDNLLIDGAVQVCGNMPFNSIIELGGIVPSTGSGCVQYTCGDECSMCK